MLPDMDMLPACPDLISAHSEASRGRFQLENLPDKLLNKSEKSGKNPSTLRRSIIVPPLTFRPPVVNHSSPPTCRRLTIRPPPCPVVNHSSPRRLAIRPPPSRHGIWNTYAGKIARSRIYGHMFSIVKIAMLSEAIKSKPYRTENRHATC